MNSTKRKNILTLIIIILIIPIPSLIFKDKVKFAPEIFLNEWYKALFITGLISFFYKYYIEKKIETYTEFKIQKKE